MAAGVTFVASAFVSTPVEDEALGDQLTLGFESRAAGCANGCGPERCAAPWAAHQGSVRIGVGVSAAPDARQAGVEAAAHARDELAGEAPTLAVLLGSRSHTDKAVDVLDAVQRMVEAPALIGCVAQAIIAGRQEIEDEPAVAVWLAAGPAAGAVQPGF